MVSHGFTQSSGMCPMLPLCTSKKPKAVAPWLNWHQGNCQSHLGHILFSLYKCFLCALYHLVKSYIYISDILEQGDVFVISKCVQYKYQDIKHITQMLHQTFSHPLPIRRFSREQFDKKLPVDSGRVNVSEPFW